MKKHLFLLSILINSLLITAKAQIIIIEGKVVDTTNNAQKGVPFVNIGFPAYSIGTSSNELGAFIIKIPKERIADTLVFSSIGFITLKIAVKTLIDKENYKIITLKPNDIKLDEVVIKSLDANKLIKSFLKNREKNYATEPALMQVFCSETMKNARTDQYFAQSEGVVEVFKSSVKKNDDHVRLLKGRKKNLSNKYTNENAQTFVIPDVVNGPTMAVILDVVKNPDFFLLKNDQFNFAHNGYERLNERLAYTIYFSPKDSSKRSLLSTDGDFFQGVIYLDTATLTMIKAEFQLSARGIRASNLYGTNTEQPLILTKRTFTIDYAEYKNKWFFKSGNVVNKYTHSDTKLSLSHKMNSFVTEIKLDSVKKFGLKKEIKTDESLGEKISHFDDSFWADFNFIKSIDNSIDTLQENEIEPIKSTTSFESTKSVESALSMGYERNKQVNFFKGSLKEAQKLAKVEKKFIFIDVFTTWCGPCKLMAREAFNDEETTELMNTFLINLQVDAEAGGRLIAQKYNVRAYPTTLVIDSTGAIIAENRGYDGVKFFREQMEEAISKTSTGNAYFTIQKAYLKRKKDFDILLLYASLRKQLGMNTEYLTDDLVKNMPVDSLQQIHYQQFISAYTNEIEGKTFDFILAHRDFTLFENKLKLLVKKNFELAFTNKDKKLFKKVLKANSKIITDPLLAEEKNKELALKFEKQSE
jgi:thiol-disulfide isomerase/thioredoxin